jgi:hypothetical protein
MKFHIRTMQILLIVATGPMWAITASAKAGCLLPVVGLWSVLVFLPLGLMGLAWRSFGRSSVREMLTALFAAIAIVGYLIALFAILMTICLREPWRM